MVRPESTTDPSQHRCPNCDSHRTFPIRDGSSVHACKDCGWPFDSVQELYAALLDQTYDCAKELQETMYKTYGPIIREKAKEQLRIAARRALLTPSHASLPATPEKLSKKKSTPVTQPKSSVGRKPTKTDLHIEAEKLHLKGRNWPQCAETLTPDVVAKIGRKAAGERLRVGVADLKKSRRKLPA